MMAITTSFFRDLSRGTILRGGDKDSKPYPDIDFKFKGGIKDFECSVEKVGTQNAKSVVACDGAYPVDAFKFAPVTNSVIKKKESPGDVTPHPDGKFRFDGYTGEFIKHHQATSGGKGDGNVLSPGDVIPYPDGIFRFDRDRAEFISINPATSGGNGDVSILSPGDVRAYQDGAFRFDTDTEEFININRPLSGGNGDKSCVGNVCTKKVTEKAKKPVTLSGSDFPVASFRFDSATDDGIENGPTNTPNKKFPTHEATANSRKWPIESFKFPELTKSVIKGELQLFPSAEKQEPIRAPNVLTVDAASNDSGTTMNAAPR
jgi:hypothetical protein